MHLTGIKLGGVPPFTDPITLRFDERVNVFIGPNASGKSTLLQVLASQLKASFDDSKRSLGDAVFHFHHVNDDKFEEFVKDMRMHGSQGVLAISEECLEDVPVVLIGSVREGLPGISNQESLEDYGDTAAEALAEPFSGSSTMRASILLGKELWETERDDLPRLARVTLMRAVELADACSQRICDEVIRDSKSHNYIPGPDVRGWINHPHANPANIPILRLMGINTTDIRNFGDMDYWEQPARDAYNEDEDSLPIYLGHLSSGTEGTLLWIRWLALKLVHYYGFDGGTDRPPGDPRKFKDGWDQKPAILLIDEIENHLHPTWQRRVIPALLEHFPKLQIFATTHSPFVVAGLKAGQVHKLERDKNGMVTATTEQRDVIGWTADEILRGMMGVDDPTDDATATAARELRQLRQEGPRVDEKAEEERQQRMLELRGLVDRDLLAGGPMAAQRELFEQQFAEALENYRRSQDLGQESH